MKKIFAVVAVAALSLGAVSCGEKKAEETVEATNDTLNAEVDSATINAEEVAPVDSAATKVDEVAPVKEEAPTTETPVKEEAPAAK